MIKYTHWLCNELRTLEINFIIKKFNINSDTLQCSKRVSIKDEYWVIELS